MEDSYVSLVSNFIMDPDRLSDDDLDDVELDEEEEEEEEEVDDDFYDFLPFQKEFLMPLRDRAFSWDVSLEDGLHGENMHLFAPTSTYEHNNPKLVIKAKRMQVTKAEPDLLPIPVKVEKDLKKPTFNNKTILTTKTTHNDLLSTKNESVSSPKLSFVLSKSSSSSYTLKNTNSSSNTGNTTALAMKPPTRLPSQGNSSSLSRMSAATNHNKSTPVLPEQHNSASDSIKTMSPANTTTAYTTTTLSTPVESSTNHFIPQIQQEEPQLAKHNAEIAQEIQALFTYAGGVGDEESDQMFDNSVRNLERIMMHPDESDEDHQRRHAMETLADQQNFAASSSSSPRPAEKLETTNALQVQTPSSSNSMLSTNANANNSKGPLQGVSGLLGAGGLTGLNGAALGGGQLGLRPMILDGFSNMNDHLLGGGPSPMHHMQRVHGMQPFGSFGGGLNSINGNNLSNHILTMNNMSGAGLSGPLGGPLSVGGMHAHSTGGGSSNLGGEYRVGAYTREERQMKIEAFRAKKRKRIWRKQIKYDCRKRLADTRPRVKGRFVSRKLGEGDDMSMMTGGMMDEGDYLMGDGSGGGGGMLNRHMLLDPHTGLLMGGMGMNNMNNMNNMMFMNSLSGSNGGLASLNSLGATGMYGGLLSGQQQMPYGGGMNFGGGMLGGMDGSLSGFPQQPIRTKKNRNNHTSNNSQSSGMTSSGTSGGGLSSKDLMSFQIQQRYANAVYNNGGVGLVGGGDLMFNPQVGMGGATGMDFLNNSMLPSPSSNQMFMPPLDFTSGAGGLLGIKPELGVGVGGVGTNMGTNMFNDQMAMQQMIQLQQQQLLYMQSLTNSFNNNNSTTNVNLGGDLSGLQMLGNIGPTDGFQQLQHQMLQQQQQQQQQQHQDNVDLKTEENSTEELEEEERAAAEEEDEEEDEEEEDTHEE